MTGDTIRTLQIIIAQHREKQRKVRVGDWLAGWIVVMCRNIVVVPKVITIVCHMRRGRGQRNLSSVVMVVVAEKDERIIFIIIFLSKHRRSGEHHYHYSLSVGPYRSGHWAWQQEHWSSSKRTKTLAGYYCDLQSEHWSSPKLVFDV